MTHARWRSSRVAGPRYELSSCRARRVGPLQTARARQFGVRLRSRAPLGREPPTGPPGAVFWGGPRRSMIRAGSELMKHLVRPDVRTACGCNGWKTRNGCLRQRARKPSNARSIGCADAASSLRRTARFQGASRAVLPRQDAGLNDVDRGRADAGRQRTGAHPLSSVGSIPRRRAGRCL